MEIRKAHWQDEGDNIRLTMPIAKVDQEKRLVSGWASLDNIDTQRDLVDALASKDAFARFRGNIREQHDEKKAVGKLVDFKEDTFYNQDDNKFYQGVYVTAYVSKGAQDTWEKVMDGTLSGFSIGGNVEQVENDVDEDGKPFRRVKKYNLTELSLVDNPANQLANVLSFQKAADGGQVMTGDLADITLENVSVCNKCLGGGHGVHVTKEEISSCPMCGEKLVKIGFVESSDPEPKATISKMVDNYITTDREGGVTETMADTKVDVADSEKYVEVQAETVEEAPATEVKTEEAVVEVKEEESEAPAEVVEVKEETTVTVEEAADPLTSTINSLREIAERLENGAKEQADELRKSMDELDKRFEEKFNTISGQVEGLQKAQESFSKRFEGIDESVKEVQKGLRDVDASTAMKKSADFDQSEDEDNSKSNFWKGSFLTI